MLRLPYSTEDYKLNSFLTTHLLPLNGFLINVDSKTYSSIFYRDSEKECTITLRRPPSSDFAVFDQVFVLDEYQPLVDLIKKNEPENRGPLTIIDAGGNVGITSIFLNNIFPGSRFIIVEPDKKNFSVLEKNILQNKFIGSKLVNAGVWSKSTYLLANRDFRDGNDWSVSVTESDKPTDLKGYSIHTLMDLLKFDIIDILKIDIEGSEKQLFNDENSATEFLCKTKYIAIEIHDEFDCRDQINKCLALNNFEFFLKDGLTIGVNRNLVTQVS